MTKSEPANTDQGTSRAVGAMLMVAALAIVFFMAHHPTSAHTSAGVPGLVHGAMIVLLGVLMLGFSHYSLRRGLDNPLVLAGLIAYAMSWFCHVGAATINGLVVPALVSGQAGSVSHETLLLCWESNQALARVGVQAIGVAFVCWAIELLRSGIRGVSVIAFVGIAAGLLPALALLSGRFAIDVRTALMVYSAHAVWTFLIGTLLLRKDLTADKSGRALR